MTRKKSPSQTSKPENKSATAKIEALEPMRENSASAELRTNPDLRSVDFGIGRIWMQLRRKWPVMLDGGFRKRLMDFWSAIRTSA
jgi:hypothetical protein